MRGWDCSCAAQNSGTTCASWTSYPASSMASRTIIRRSGSLATTRMLYVCCASLMNVPSRYTNAETHIALAYPRRVDLRLWPFESCARDTKRLDRTDSAPCWTHSSLCHWPYAPMSLHIPIGLNEGIDHVSAIHTKPPVILPRMLVEKMYRDDEPVAAFTSHMPLAIRLSIFSLEPTFSRPPLSREAGRFDGSEEPI